MTTRPTRRVRAGTPPPDSTGCLPVDYTAQQIDAWAREQDQERRHAGETIMKFKWYWAPLLLVLIPAQWVADAWKHWRTGK